MDSEAVDKKNPPFDGEEPSGGEEAPPLEPPEGELGFLPDLLRKGLSLGFTGLFITEEAFRRALGPNVPRDWIEFFVAQSERTRNEIADRFSRELGRVLSTLDPVEVARRLLDGRTIEVTAQFRLKPDGPAASPPRSPSAPPEPRPDPPDPLDDELG